MNPISKYGSDQTLFEFSQSSEVNEEIMAVPLEPKVVR